MEVSVCSQDGSVSLYFVLPAGLTQETCSTGLLCAFQACQENGLISTWLSTEDCLNMVPSKQDVFICDPFDGKAFQHLISGFKCVVLGPRCILSSIHRKEPIPELPSPIHNTAMKGLVITTTGFEKDAKTDLQWLVERMAGIYSNNFHESVTHLVANSVGSKKYCVAVQQEVPVMTGEWVKAVWKSVSQDFQEDILATDQQFLSYACPVFKGLVICVSQMPRKEKGALKKMIEENGGTYSSTLDMSGTSVLIIPTPEGDKYNYARNWRIQCLTPDWIYDSVEQGSALHMDGYKVVSRGASTPTNDNTGNVPPDISLCSTIMNESETPRLSHINETLDMDMSMAMKKDSVGDDKFNRGLEAIENLDLQQAMKAGMFLDGCKIFLSGFSTTHIEKLRRVLNAGGATRFNQLNESVSHVVLGKSGDEHLNAIQTWTSKPHIVYADWIIESIKLRRPADEAPFSYLLDTEKCTTSNKHNKFAKVPAAALTDNNETYVDEEILNQYLRTPSGAKDVSMNETANMSSLPDSQISFVAGIFSGRVFTVSGYDEETTEDIITAIREHGGKTVLFDYKGRVHFSLLDVNGNGTVHSKAEEIITFYFIEDCIEQKELLPVDYFHVPLCLQGSNCLEGCNIAISTYKGKERIFLVNIATALGAMFQEVFAKKSNAAKNVTASTHLICPAAEGDKYRAAAKWGVPAVTCDWLLVCARSLKRESEDVYNVNNTNYPELDRKALIGGLGGECSNSTLCRVEETLEMDRNDTLVPATPVNKQVKTLREQFILSPSKIKTPDPESFRKLYPTPGVSKNNRSLSEMLTPDTPYGSTWYPNPSSHIRKGFKRLIDSIPEPAPAKRRVPPGTPVEEYYKRFCNDVKETVQNYKVKDPVWLRKDKNEKLVNENVKAVAADNHGPLTGVVVCTSNKLQSQQKELYQTVADLGGDYRWAYDHTVTHYVFQGRNNDTNKEFRIAREQGKFIVAPDWVWMCHDEKTKIDELLFPHTHNPKMSLSIVSTKATPNTKKVRPIKKTLFENEKISDEEDEETTGQSNNSEENLENEDQKKAALSKQLEEIEALATNSGSGRRNSGACRNRSINDRLKHTPTRPMQVETQPVTAEVPESQNTAITWDDPVEREARLKLQHQLTKDTQDIINENQQLSDEGENDKENSPEDQDVTLVFDAERDVSPLKIANQLPLSKPQHIIVLLGMTEEEKSRYTKIVEELGGTISMEQNFDPTSTHVVTGKPSRSERHLAAIASGKWMLCNNFLEDSFKAECFVKEEPYEWGNPATTCIPALAPESLEFKLASAARRWRLKIHDVSNDNETKGAFQNMKALIHSSRERIGAFSRLIEAGGGKIIRGIPPYTQEKDVTHFFLEMSKTQEKIDLANFAAHQIPVLLPIFLNEYLIKYPLPIEADHCIPEYKQIVADMSRADQSPIKRSRKK